MAHASKKDRIREAMGVAVSFHLLIFVPCMFMMGGGDEFAKIGAFAMIPFWSMVTLIVWKRGRCATRVDYAFIAYAYPIIFGGLFLWNGLAATR